MPSILSEEDKETVKRVVPKQTNKIQAVAVAKLYVAFPDRARWNYTGLQGAIVLSNDLVGNTYWLKLVDVSPAGRGVIWDQEIYDTWNYNQDRTFFHSFETEECLAGLSFVDEKEAKQFKKKMDEREKNASKATRNTPFGGASQQHASGGHKSFLGGIFGGHRHATSPTPPESPRTILPPVQSHTRTPSLGATTNGFTKSSSSGEFAELEAYDPDWRDNFGNFLREQGLTDEFIKENQGFIVEFLEQQGGSAQSHAPPPPTNGSPSHGRAPPPPPPAGADGPTSSGSRRGVPPPPPAPRRSGKASDAPALREPTPPQEPPAPPAPRFKAPPPLADAGKFAHEKPAQRPTPAVPGPPPPPRPAKQAIEEKDDGHKFGVPPPFAGQRLSNNPPPPPARGPVPPPPPRDSSGRPPLVPPGLPPTLPPKVPAATAPPLPPMASRPVPAPPPRNAVPPPPPSSNIPPPPPPPPPGGSAAPPPPPPPPPSGGVPPPPPPPPPPAGGPASALPSADSGRSAMLGDIQRAGGIGALKKVDRSKIRDRSGASVPGASDTGSSGAAAAGGAAAGGAGGMADALAAALSKRKAKVRDSDDEKSDDDW